MADSFHRGHLNIFADLGTILGPNSFGEYLVARECTHEKSLACLWTATKEDFQAMYARGTAQSVTEHKLMNPSKGK